MKVLLQTTRSLSTKCLDGQHHTPARFTLGKYPVPIAQNFGWSSGPVCIDPKKLAPQGLDPRTVQLVLIRYTRLCYPGRLIAVTIHPDVKRFPLP